MHLSEVNKALDHKICGGSEYGWNCWPNARFLDYESEYAHASVVFNSETQEIYTAEINDKVDKYKPYRWLNPEYTEVMYKEARQRRIEANQAWDEVMWCDLETPEDWIEKNIYSKYNYAGVSLMMLINILLFGWIGIIVWLVQMLWIPFWAAGVINGLGHWIGYRNGTTRDRSHNIFPIGIWIGGEELHNNHHLDPANAKLSKRWFEFDIGWFWIKTLSHFNIIKIKKDS
jgi:hypothetical protein